MRFRRSSATADRCQTSSAAISVEGGGGRVLPIPEWMTFKTTKLPSEQEVEPWFEAVCALWDDPALYRSIATRARQIADERYSERVSRKKHVDYFTSLKPGGRPLADTPRANR